MDSTPLRFSQNSLLAWKLGTDIRAVLLDFDGTLVDSEPLHYEAWLNAVEPYGASTDWPDYVARFVGKTDTWAAETFLTEAGGEVDPALIRRVCDAKHAYFRERSPQRLSVTGGVVNWILERLGGRLVGVVSSSISRDVEPTLVKGGLRDRLDVVVCGEHVKRHKPDPEPYLLALERLRSRGAGLDAAQVVAFEDSSSGLASATAAGMDVVRVDAPTSLVTLLAARIA